MKQSLSKILFNPLSIILILVWLYVLIPFLAPIAYVNGRSDIGWKINTFYANFCHQRVERSIFLFGKDKAITFYTVKELKKEKAIPQVNPNPEGYVWPEYFGHRYVGNSDVGYKVPLCIRDIALYLGVGMSILVILILPERIKKQIRKWNVIKVSLLLIPMAVDGVLQSFVEILQLKQFPDWYVSSNLKRIVTGLLFGIGTGIIIYILLSWEDEKSLTKQSKKGKMKV